jgi:uncharacterized protein (DUF2147 family)
MTILIRCMLIIGASLLAPCLLADNLVGLWKNDDQPAWIEISFDEGVGRGTVVRNEKNSSAVGRVLLKELTARKGTNSWSGQIFAQQLNEFKDAELSLPEPDHMQILVKVGFMSRTVTWARVAALPATSASE